MKKVLFVFALLALLSISCNKKYKFYGFDITKDISVSVPVDVFEVDSVYTFDLFIDNVFETHDTKSELVEQITIEDVSINAVGYNHFSDLKFYISTDTQQEVLLAKNDTIDYYFDYATQTTKVKLNQTEALMDSYVKESKIYIRVSGKLPTALNIASSASVNLRFRVLTYIN
jgi:hypothetical protein